MKKQTAQAISKAFAFLSPSKENAYIIIDWLVPKIDVAAFGKALTYYYSWKQTHNPDLVPSFDPVGGLFVAFGSVLLRDEATVRKYAREWWPYIDQFLSDPYTVIEYMKHKEPKLIPLLDSDIGQAYAEYYAKRLYDFFNIWVNRFPLYHGNDQFQCGGLIRFVELNHNTNEWGFQCRICKKIILLEDIDTETYSGRKYGR